MDGRRTDGLRGLRPLIIPLGIAAVLLTAPTAAEAADFIRGDTNGDGRVTISDAQRLDGYMFLGNPQRLECMNSGDVNDDELIDLTDTIFIIRALFQDLRLSEPFPDAGPDSTPSGDFMDCKSYGNGTPLEDPAAGIRIRDVTMAGGTDRKVVVTIEVSSSVPIAGYSFLISGLETFLFLLSDGETIQEPVPTMRDLSVPLTKTDVLVDDGRGNLVTPTREHSSVFAGSYVDGKLSLGVLWSLHDGFELPPGEDVAILELHTCLEPGTPAGTYPLNLEAGELASFDGRAILPILTSGTLAIGSDVLEGDCDPKAPPPPGTPPKILFKMADAEGAPGSDVTVPFAIKTDRPTSGFSYSAAFDGAVLNCQETRKLWTKPDGTPYDFEKFEWDNAAGYVMGAAIISLEDTGEVIPIGQEVEMIEIKFLVSSAAPAGSTPLEFRDGAPGTGGPVTNKIISGGSFVTPALESGFVLVNGRVNILPEPTPFRVGDSNGDGVLDLSDAVFTLAYLYSGGKTPSSMKAADYNGDGTVDISDPIATIDALFLGGN